ncbi:hypothetical protein BRADI_3g43266v3 [Brachypodium distachyon]|uniref:Uncharacterized protein n=1 Tax=Brachypodium distachyon TaxID=15368 RepID=A0A0Q3I0M0_BRADI|nr:hypothetical protein BRADI_3g43266v3 [Brachypodium distachyon]
MRSVWSPTSARNRCRPARRKRAVGGIRNWRIFSGDSKLRRNTRGGWGRDARRRRYSRRSSRDPTRRTVVSRRASQLAGPCIALPLPLKYQTHLAISLVFQWAKWLSLKCVPKLTFRVHRSIVASLSNFVNEL